MLFSEELDIILREHMDLSDRETLHTLAYLDESEKARVATNLTSRLYDKIVNKTYDIDFGTIPKSRGDITKIENYDALLECVNILRDIVLEYHQPTTPIDVVSTAIDNVASRRDLFMKAYAVNIELPIVVYNTTVLAIVASVSYLISGCIEYIKSPDAESYQLALDKISYTQTSNNLLFENLSRFNNSCASKELDKTLNDLMHTNAKHLSGGTGGVLAAVTIIGLAKFIIPFLQDLVYFFYHSRQKVSDYFATQADLLQMNAANVMYRDDVRGDKEKVIAHQNKIAGRFRKVSNFFDINYKKAKKDAQKMKDLDKSEKYTSSDLDQSDSSNDSLF